jgi:outer membrane immunogenic protein
MGNVKEMKTVKKILLTTVGLAALGMAPAFGADLAARTYTKAPPLAALPTWAGFYVGAMGGYASQDSGDSIKGGFGGGTAGYNWQTGKFVYGIEVDAAGADISASFGVPGFVSAEDKIRALGTVRGRVGVAFDQVLLYGTGGFAWADQKLSATVLGFSASDSQTRVGWTAGAGVEYMFAPHWSLKGEYLYRSFSSEDFHVAGFGTVPSGTLNIHSGQFGVNYHF